MPRSFWSPSCLPFASLLASLPHPLPAITALPSINANCIPSNMDRPSFHSHACQFPGMHRQYLCWSVLPRKVGSNATVFAGHHGYQQTQQIRTKLEHNPRHFLPLWYSLAPQLPIVCPDVRCARAIRHTSCDVDNRSPSCPPGLHIS